MTVSIILGDCRDQLRLMEPESMDCCITSPPYFGLRDYGVEGQIGLERTPDEFVAEMVSVFREVRRVLRGDGTLWLNLGDSYATNGGAGWQGKNGMRADRRFTAPNYRRGMAADDGTKPKDLIGIPWRVAFALQQPYYAGDIKREADRIWLAAMVDGEGCFYVHRRPAGQHAGDGYFRKQDSYSPAFEVANTHKAIIDRCLEIAGCGSVIRQDKDRRQPLWRWTVRSDEARRVAREIYPYLVGKQQQCRIICEMPSNGTMADASWQAMKLLHAGSETTVDFAAPKSMHEPGFYLRQDLIWAKPNPMPESVRDRCTKAHEYVFLMAKSERYFYDADAIKEPASENTHARLPGNKRHSAAEAYEAGDKFHRTKAGLVAYSGRKRAAAGSGIKSDDGFANATAGLVSNRNKRSVWTVGSEPFGEAHFATFPPALIEPMILAGCPVGGTVLDPFGGAGTTGLVADRLGRNALLIELNPSYADMARRRIGRDAPLFADVVSA